MIYLITPTGARPQQIRHCAEWMKNQTYTGKATWIIVDDGLPETTEFIKEDFKENWEIIKVFPRPAWMPGMNTQGRNIAAGLSKVENGKDNIVFIIEDDDYYKPVYIEKPMAVSYKDCLKINRVSENTGVPCFVAYYRRTLPYFLRVKQRLVS